MTQYKYQEDFAADLAIQWLNGNKSDVRTKIRNLKNKAQAAYIAAVIVAIFAAGDDTTSAADFINFMHPNNQ